MRRSDLDQALARAGLAVDLRGALELLDGRLVDHKRERVAREQVWRALLARIDESRLQAFGSDTTGVALLKRLSAGDAGQAGTLLA